MLALKSNGSTTWCSTLFLLWVLLGARWLSAGEPRVLIGRAADRGAVWRYTTSRPGDEWIRPDFDDGRWSEGKAGFGVVDQVTPQERIGTPWTTPDVWLRKVIDVPQPEDFRTAALYIRHDEDVEVHVNARQIFAAAGYNVETTAHDVTKALKTALKPGRNLVAVHVRQTTGGQYIDLALVLDPKEKPPAAIDPAALEKLRKSRWSAQRAWKWYRAVGPICGCNYLPRTAVNSTEMWQAETFDPKTIDQELGWAQKHGLNSVRVFVQYIVYESDPEGLIRRMGRFLEIADKHGISVMFILFDDCWIQEPALGEQPGPVPGVHNSRWTASPGRRRKRRESWPALEKYVRRVIGRFARDKRVIVWDLYNEPKKESRPLVEAAFGWARSARPEQPLTTCWQASDLWDVASFHDYGPPKAAALARRTSQRPALCTECIARTRGSRIENVLPVFAEQGIGWYMWGLVKGRIQTHYPWGSKKGAPEPEVWFHDLLHPDGTPYAAGEIRIIRRFPGQFRMPREAENQRPGGHPRRRLSFHHGNAPIPNAASHRSRRPWCGGFGVQGSQPKLKWEPGFGAFDQSGFGLAHLTDLPMPYRSLRSQNSSGSTSSPPLRVSRARMVAGDTSSLTNLVCPSANTTIAPPGWLLEMPLPLVVLIPGAIWLISRSRGSIQWMPESFTSINRIVEAVPSPKSAVFVHLLPGQAVSGPTTAT